MKLGALGRSLSFPRQLCSWLAGLRFLSNEWLSIAARPTEAEHVGEVPERWTSAHSRCLPPPPAKELEEVYQDTASNMLVAVCRHAWHRVTQHLETEVLTGVFPHRSLLYVMGILTSDRTSCPWVPRHPQATLCLQPSMAGVERDPARSWQRPTTAHLPSARPGWVGTAVKG